MSMLSIYVMFSLDAELNVAIALCWLQSHTGDR